MARVRLEYIDLLKLLSILSIITLHVFKVWTQTEIMGIRIYGFTALVKFGVPVFIMISGALLLNREIEIGSFLKKKVQSGISNGYIVAILPSLNENPYRPRAKSELGS